MLRESICKGWDKEATGGLIAAIGLALLCLGIWLLLDFAWACIVSGILLVCISASASENQDNATVGSQE